MQKNITKQLPFSEEAEKSVIGAMLLENQAINEVMGKIKAKDFYIEENKILFEIITNMFDNGDEVDLVKVRERVNAKGLSEKIPTTYITNLCNRLATTANVLDHVKIIEEKSILRKIILTSREMNDLGYQEEKPLQKILDKIETKVFDITDSKQVKGFDNAHDILLETLSDLEEKYASDGDITGLPTGFRDLDNMTSGFQDSDLVIIAARPSMGKTALALNIAQHVALNHDKNVGVFSLEMSKSQLMQRVLCSEAKVNNHRLRTGNLADDDWDKITKVSNEIANSGLHIDDTPSLSVMEAKAKARRLKASEGLDILFIDYLQLMEGAGDANSRQQEIAKISRSLKNLARELDIPVVALSQLNRAVEQRNDKRPRMSDIRSSGAIEQDADIIAFLYRDEYYNPDTEREGITEIILGKQRNGPVGTVELGFEKRFTKFVNLNPKRN